MLLVYRLSPHRVAPFAILTSSSSSLFRVLRRLISFARFSLSRCSSSSCCLSLMVSGRVKPELAEASTWDLPAPSYESADCNEMAAFARFDALRCERCLDLLMLCLMATGA